MWRGVYCVRREKTLLISDQYVFEIKLIHRFGRTRYIINLTRPIITILGFVTSVVVPASSAGLIARRCVKIK